MAITQIAEIYEVEYRYGDPSTFPPSSPGGPGYTPAGWFDAGRTVTAWFDDDWVLKTERIPLQLVVAQPAFFLNENTIFPMVGPGGRSLITVIVYHPLMFDDADLIFSPIAVRKLDPPDRFLKNEVLRTR